MFGRPIRFLPAFALWFGFQSPVVALGAETGRTDPRLIPAFVSTSSNAPASRGTNRLAREKSPYLLQHRHNPVDWYPWGEEAFAKARAENKPIFLSIGYSTCHWCHVMERESFEDAATADLLNSQFVSIKVDREERPDVDKIYMTYVQARTGNGGWPLNVFLTSSRDPFYGGTYWPPENRRGRPSFRDVLGQVAAAWRERREEVVASASDMTERLRAHFERNVAGTREAPEPALLEKAAASFKGVYDSRHGGFGRAPKFPRPAVPSLLLRHALRTGDAEAIRMVLHTCDRMAAGGMHDQLGGGFARYSVDAEWKVPHFEKMLYDNAQLAHLYLDAWLVGGDAGHAAVVRSIIGYVLRDMTHAEGGFFSAEDADSEGHEGKFYCWTLSELKDLLAPPELAAAIRHFGITEKGNFEDHSHPSPLRFQNVLHVAKASETTEEATRLASVRRKMLEARSHRVRPHRDDKILASWNGLMLGALARASIAMNEPTWLEAARANLRFLRSRLWTPPERGGLGVLNHRWRDGERDRIQLLDDYALLLDGVIHLYEATLEDAHLEFAIEIAEAMLSRFEDREAGGFWQSGSDSADLIVRAKEDYDGAEPSGNSVASLALLRLAAITERKEFRDAAERTLRFFGDRLATIPEAVPYFLLAFDFSLQAPFRVVIASEPQDPARHDLLRAAHSVFQPHRVVLGTTGRVEPFARTLTPKDSRATAYVCSGTVCQPPSHEVEAIKKSLRRPGLPASAPVPGR